MSENWYKYQPNVSKVFSQSRESKNLKMKSFTVLFVAIVIAGLVGANPPNSPTVKPVPPSSVLPGIINFVNRLFATVKALLQLVVHGLAVAVNSVLEILIVNLLRLLLLLVPGSTPVPLAALETAVLAVKEPTVFNIGVAVTKLLGVELPATVILYVLPKPLASSVVDVKLLTQQLKALGKPSLTIEVLLNVFGQYLLNEYKLKL